MRKSTRNTLLTFLLVAVIFIILTRGKIFEGMEDGEKNCNMDNDCPETSFCALNKNICVPLNGKKRKGTECTNNTECIRGLCSNGKCM